MYRRKEDMRRFHRNERGLFYKYKSVQKPTGSFLYDSSIEIVSWPIVIISIVVAGFIVAAIFAFFYWDGLFLFSKPPVTVSNSEAVYSSTGVNLSKNPTGSPQLQYLTLLATNPYKNEYTGYYTNNGSLNCTSNRNFYIDQFTGSDNNNGLSPQTTWQSIEKTNSMTFVGGDTIWICKNNRHFHIGLGLGITIKISSSSANQCSVKLRSYDCGQSNNRSLQQSLPLLTIAYPLPQVTNYNGYTFQWLSMNYTLYNGTQIQIVYYDTTNIKSTTQLYTPPPYGVDEQDTLFVNNMISDNLNQIPPLSIIPSDTELPYYNGGNVTLWNMNEVWHLDASITQYAFGALTITSTNYTMSISPGSWCRNIYSLLFGSNETLYNATFYNKTVANKFLVGGQIQYATLTYAFSNQGILQVIPPDFRCCWFYQTYVIPWAGRNGIDLSLGWNNHLIDQIGVNSTFWGTTGYTPAKFIINGSPGYNSDIYPSDTPWPYPFRVYGDHFGFGIVTGSMYRSNRIIYYYPRSQTEYNQLLYSDTTALSNLQAIYRNPNNTVALIRPFGGSGPLAFQPGDIEVQEMEFAYFGNGIYMEGTSTLSVHHCIFHDYQDIPLNSDGNTNHYIAYNNIVYNGPSGFRLDAKNNIMTNSSFLNLGPIVTVSTTLVRNISHTNTGTDWIIANSHDSILELSTFNNCQLLYAEWNCLEFVGGVLRYNFFANQGNGDKLLRFFDNHNMMYHAQAYGLNFADVGPYLFHGNTMWNISMQGICLGLISLSNNLFINTDGNWFGSHCNMNGFDNNTSIFQIRRTHPYGPVDYYPYGASTAFPYTLGIGGVPPDHAIANQGQGSHNYACFSQFDYNISFPDAVSFQWYPNMKTTNLWYDYKIDGFGAYWPSPYPLPQAPCQYYCDGIPTGKSTTAAQYFYVSDVENQYYFYGGSQNISFGVDRCSNMTQNKQDQLQRDTQSFTQITEPLIALLTAGYYQNYSAPQNWPQMIYTNPYYVGLIPMPIITSSPSSYATTCAT